MVLMHENSGLDTSAKIYGYPSVPLKFNRLAGVIEHSKALAGIMNAASLNLIAGQVEPTLYSMIF